MKNFNIFLLFILSILLSSCEKFLDSKPDQSLTIPRNMDDLEMLLDNFGAFNRGFSNGLGDAASDDHFLSYSNWLSRPEHFRMEYILEKKPVYENYWILPYLNIFISNNVVDLIDKVSDSDKKGNDILGRALFYRALNHYDILQLFSPAFDQNKFDTDIGIPLKLNTDVTQKNERSTLGESYHQVLNDLLLASELINTYSISKSRPNKASCFAALSRIYMSMRDYKNAELYSKKALDLNNELMNFNDLIIKPYPFDKFNKEVLFYSEYVGYGGIAENISRVDSNLYNSYDNNDLRKKLFFTKKSDGYYAFTGDFSQNSGNYNFNGLTTSEMLLNYSESLLRNGNLVEAINQLNRLTNNRYFNYTKNLFVLSENELLNEILMERRKELVMRGVRWSDLRRLSFEDDQNVNFKRVLQSDTIIITNQYIKEFAFFIPTDILNISEIKQNN